MLISVSLSLHSKWSRSLRLGFLTIVPFALYGQPASVDGSMPEDYLPELRPILMAALKQSPRSIQRSIDLAQAEASRYSGDAALWPSLSGNASYSSYTAASASAGFDTSTTSKGIYYGVAASQPVYYWGSLKAQADISRLGVKIAERQFAEAYLQLTVTLRAQYLDLITQKVGLRNLRNQYRLVQNNLATQEAKLKEGLISPGALTGPKLAVDEVSLSVERAAQHYDHARRAFARLAGLDTLPEESIPLDVKLPVYGADTAESLLSSFLGGGVEKTMQGQIYVMNLKQSDLTYRIAKTRLYPKFSISAGYYLSNSQSAAGEAAVSQVAIASYYTGITANWTIFDGFATRGAKLSALASKRSYERQFQTYIDTTMETAQNLRKQVGFAARALNLAQTRLALARDALNRVNEDFKLGTLAQTDVDEVTVGFHLAEQAAISARADYFDRWSEFVSLVGADPIASVLPARYLSHGK